MRNKWNWLRKEILILLLTGFNVILGFIILPLLLVPLFLYRSIVIVIVKQLRPELTHILQSQTLIALENVTNRPKSNLVGCFVLDGQLSAEIEQLQSLFTSRVLENVDGKGELVYPELRQIWTSFMGYFFWKNEKHFDIREHIRIFDYNYESNEETGADPNNSKKELYTEEEVKEVATRLLSEPWKPDFSPWEFLIIPKYVENNNFNENIDSNADKKGNSVLILRLHHTMGDGQGWLNILLNELCQCKDDKLPKMTMPKKPTWWQNVLLLPLKLPYDFAKTVVESHDTMDPSRNPWHTPYKRAKKYYTSITSPISVQRVKDLKNKFGVAYAAILITAISGGIRRVMKQAGQNVPENMTVAMVLPLPNHPGKICVHASAINLCWPIGTEDPILRLQKVWEDIRSKQSSLFPLVPLLLARLGGVVPHIVFKTIYNKGRMSMLASLFPGPTTFPTFLECTTTDLFVAAGIPPGQAGAFITSIALGGRQRITVTIDNTLFPSHEKFEELGGFIEQELRDLELLSVSTEFNKFECKSLENVDIV